MTRTEAAALVMSRLGKRTGLDTEVGLELLKAQADLEAKPFLPWFLKEPLALSTAASVRSVALPSDFLRETEEKLWITTSDGVRPLCKGAYDDLLSREVFDTDLLSSNYYDVVGSNLYIFPTPDSIMAVSGFYFAADDTAAATNKWLTRVPGLLIALAGMRMAKTLRDDAAYNLFKEDYQIAQADMIASDIARAQAAKSAIMGG